MITQFYGLSVFFTVFWKSGVALGAALGVSLLLRRKSADVRRLVLSTAVVAMFVAAAVLPMLPRWTAVTPQWFQVQRPAARAVSEQASAPVIIGDDELAAPDAQLPAAQPLVRRIDLSSWLIPLIWFVGASTLLTRFAINLLGLHRLRKASEAVPDAGLVAGAARFGRRVELWRSEVIGAPVTWGIVRPIILVPAGFEELPADCRDAVLCHELAHIQAHDFLMRGLAEIGRALIWFQPLMWIVWQQLREEQELACDNRVLATGRRPSAYAKLLLVWESSPGLDSLIAVGIANRSCLKRRLYALLDPDLRRDTVASAAVAVTWLLGLATALPLAAISFTQAIPAQLTPARAMQAAAPPAQLLTAPQPPVQMAQVQASQAPVQASQAPVKAPATQQTAQPASAPKPKFDAASIKPCQPGDGPGRGGKGDMGANSNPPDGLGGYFRASPGRLDVTCAGLLTLIGVAYVDNGNPLLNNPGMHEAEQIQGIPKWALVPRYTIHAETEDPVANGPTQPAPGQGPGPAERLLYGPMLQGLLEDRFQLKIRRVQEQAPMYALTVAKNGPKLKPLEDGDCIPDGPPRWPAGGKPRCGWVGWPISGPNRTLLGGGVTLQRLATSLSQFVLDRNVIDRTGISGSFLIRLEYAPDENTPCKGPASRCVADPNTDIPPGATIFAAIEQQLGLKLEPIKGPREHIVIDSVERPSEN